VNSKSIAFLTGESIQSIALANELKKHFNLSVIVIQEIKNATKQKPVIGFLQKSIGTKLLELLLIYRKQKKERTTLLTEQRLIRQSKNSLVTMLKYFNTNTWPDVPIVRTTDLNSLAVEKFLQSLQPSLIVVWGTGILKKNIIDIPQSGVVNAHTSVLPYYRGSFVEFWQCLNGDYDHAGVTYHFINENVDEGDIICIEKYSGMRPIDPYALRNENIVSIIKNFPKVIQALLDGNYTRVKQLNENNKTYLFKHITTDLKYTLFEKMGLVK